MENSGIKTAVFFLTEFVVAFANTAGGKVYIGMDNCISKLLSAIQLILEKFIAMNIASLKNRGLYLKKYVEKGRNYL